MLDQWTCPQCGQTNSTTMHFCPQCGTANPASVTTAETPTNNRRWLWIVAVGLWVVGLAVLAVGGGVWLARQGEGQSETANTIDTIAAVEPTEVVSPTAEAIKSPTPIPTATLTPSPQPSATATSFTSQAAGDTLGETGSGQAKDTLVVDTLPTATPTPTATLPPPTPQPVAVVSSPTPATIVDCPPGVQITSPAPGATFNQRNNFIVGTANIVQFHHWRIEYSTSPGGGWNYLLERDYPVENDKLVMIDASTVPRGPYGLRLTVVDVTGNYPEPCEVWFVNNY